MVPGLAAAISCEMGKFGAESMPANSSVSSTMPPVSRPVLGAAREILDMNKVTSMKQKYMFCLENYHTRFNIT